MVSEWEPERGQAFLSVDQAWTFLDVDLDPVPELGEGLWGTVLPVAARQVDDSNTAYFVMFEFAPALGRSLYLSSRPHLPPGFSPRLRPMPEPP